MQHKYITSLLLEDQVHSLQLVHSFWNMLGTTKNISYLHLSNEDFEAIL